jgi:hypothetical protein
MPLYPVRYFEGMNIGVSNALMKDSDLRLALNFDTGDVGTLRNRKGIAIEGDTVQAGKAIEGLHYFKTPTVNQFLAFCNTSGDAGLQVKRNDTLGGNWTLIDTSSAYTGFEDADVSTVTFLDHTFIAGYDPTDNVYLPTATINSSFVFSTSANVTSAPAARIVGVFKDRAILFNVNVSGTAYPDRAYYSNTPSAGSITWTDTSGALQFVAIGNNDGEAGTGFAVNSDRALFFKRNYIEVRNFSGDSFVRVGRIEGVGATTHKSIVTYKGYTFFCNQNNGYVYSGGQQQEIFNPLKPFFRAFTSANWDNFVGWVEEDKYKVYFGAATVDGTSYTYGVMVFDIQSNQCTVYDMPQPISASMLKDTTSYLGMTGAVYKSTGTTDAGAAISYRLKTKKYDLGYHEYKKTIQDVYWWANKFQGLQFSFSIDGDKPIDRGGFRDAIQLFSLGVNAPKGRSIEFFLDGTSKYDVEVDQLSFTYSADKETS